MTPDYAEMVLAWLAKARSDLATARILIEGNERHLDTGTYHCQQAAEKALKGWLTYNEIEFRKTHDLIELLAQCIDIQPSFTPLTERARFLMPFATQFRYPGDIFEPPIDEAEEAMEHAAQIVSTVVNDLKSANVRGFRDL